MRLKPRMSKANNKPGLINKKFDVPVDVIVELEKLAHPHLWGSNGRAIQIGTELLLRMPRKPKVGKSDEPVVSQTYSITPPTLDLIEQLLPCYATCGTVLKAVVRVLQDQL